MAILVQDTFVRTDTAGNNTVSNAAGWGTSSDGNTWVRNGTGTNTFTIASSKGKITGVARPLLLLGSATAADCEGLARFSISVLDTSDDFGILLRSNAAATTFYWCRVVTSAQPALTLRSSGGGQLATVNTTLVAATSFWMRFRVTGSVSPLMQARMWQDGNVEQGTWDVSFTDTTGTLISGAGQFGLNTFPSTQTISVDSFSGASVASAVTKRIVTDGYGGVFS